ncbi:hypothetical protein COT72_02180 [archaeon CG10_big_fil_rev_8_21_14_0_10_43_11]|nr:MAG: hypothetical protein COT72_02180 [archaeon CG10_big_fil_rev_8_21_14_0_10_43_11]
MQVVPHFRSFFSGEKNPAQILVDGSVFETHTLEEFFSVLEHHEYVHAKEHTLEKKPVWRSSFEDHLYLLLKQHPELWNGFVTFPKNTHSKRNFFLSKLSPLFLDKIYLGDERYCAFEAELAQRIWHVHETFDEFLANIKNRISTAKQSQEVHPHQTILFDTRILGESKLTFESLQQVAQYMEARVSYLFPAGELPAYVEELGHILTNDTPSRYAHDTFINSTCYLDRVKEPKRGFYLEKSEELDDIICKTDELVELFRAQFSGRKT